MRELERYDAALENDLACPEGVLEEEPEKCKSEPLNMLVQVKGAAVWHQGKRQL